MVKGAEESARCVAKQRKQHASESHQSESNTGISVASTLRDGNDDVADFNEWHGPA